MILIALGANLPGPDGRPPLESCREAVRALASLPGLQLHAVSKWYESTPVPPSGQPNYVNGAARFSFLDGASMRPEALLAAMLAIEDRFGRRRAERDAARTLDLDLIDMDGLVRAAPDPVLPHPRAHLRAFVLMPVLDVAPGWVVPGLLVAGADMLAGLDRGGIAMIGP